jgi:predicted nucleic acid-binding protein
VVQCPDARQIAYDISLDRNYGTKRAKLQHRIPGRRSGTADILVAATAILYGVTIVTEDKRVTPGEAARWQRGVLVFMCSYC